MAMKKILLGIAVLSLVASTGYCQEQAQSLQLMLQSDTQVYPAGERIIFVLAVKNRTSQKVPLFEGYRLRTIVLLDGKEYKNTGGIAWGGPDSLGPDGEINIAIELQAYGITKEKLVFGKHDVAVKLNAALSNTITIEVVEKKPEK